MCWSWPRAWWLDWWTFLCPGAALLADGPYSSGHFRIWRYKWAYYSTRNEAVTCAKRRNSISFREVSRAYHCAVLSDENKQRIREQLEKDETSLLTEFHKWASPLELHQPGHAAVLRALETEVEALSDRLKKREGR